MDGLAGGAGERCLRRHQLTGRLFHHGGRHSAEQMSNGRDLSGPGDELVQHGEFAAETDVAGGRCQLTGEQSQEGGLARAIGTDQRARDSCREPDETSASRGRPSGDVSCRCAASRWAIRNFRILEAGRRSGQYRFGPMPPRQVSSGNSEGRSGRRDSNSRHPAWKASALPTELLPLGQASKDSSRDSPGSLSRPSDTGLRALKWVVVRLTADALRLPTPARLLGDGGPLRGRHDAWYRPPWS